MKHPPIVLVLCSVCLLNRVRVGESQESPNITVTVHNPPNVMYARHPIQGFCYGFPDADGTLEMRFHNKDFEGDDHMIGKYVFYKNLHSEVHRRLPMRMVLNISPDETVPGPENRVKRMVWFKICPTEALYKSYITCSSQDSKGVRMIRVRAAPSGPHKFVFKYEQGPSLPQVKTHYHFEPDIVIEGEMLRVSCTANVGTRGLLDFILKLPGKQDKHQWRVAYNLPYPTHLPEFKVEIFSKKSLTTTGPKIKATFSIEITRQLQGAILYCVSRDIFNNGSTFEKNSFNVISSKPLIVQEFPHKPHLYATNEIYMIFDKPRWILNGRCRTLTQFAQEILFVVKSGVWVHSTAVNMSSKTLNRSYKEKIPFTADTLVAFGFTGAGMPGEKWLEVRFYAFMWLESTDLRATCYVKDLKRCQRFTKLTATTIRKQAQSSRSPTVVRAASSRLLILWCLCMIPICMR
ncbi:hypothetical protein EGW08_016201 [Elysia chlorotica]|uniref:ZP domain-containing protein n=1 Tax=Elysia chlorotica TaxID=188477 RepID=A0A3S1B4S2_ELYCH|nr:hypothetical protein EGW08_016201 [Elysia chlorotica]